jgi:hypothetical protein
MTGRVSVQRRRCCKHIVIGDSFVCFKDSRERTLSSSYGWVQTGDPWDGHLKREDNIHERRKGR